MRRKKYQIIATLMILIIFLFGATSCFYLKDVSGKIKGVIKFKTNLIAEFFSFIKFNFNRLIKKIDRFFSSLKFYFKKVKFENIKLENIKEEKTEKINLLKNFGKKYDEMVLNKMLLYSSSAIPINENIIISIYFPLNDNKIDLSKFSKYHFKIVKLNKEEYLKITSQNTIEIDQTKVPSINIDTQKKGLLFLKSYKLVLKNSKPAIFSILADEENNKYYALLENLPKEFYTIPYNFNFYYKNKEEKIKYHTFYFYPLSSSLMEVVIGFYLPFEPIKVILFFAILFFIVIISLVFGYIILKQYLFETKKGENKSIKKLENNEKMDNNIDEKELKEDSEKSNTLGKEVDIAEIPDFFKDL
jgi:hypothetical protein